LVRDSISLAKISIAGISLTFFEGSKTQALIAATGFPSMYSI
jgi:hypothetical protein